MAVKLEAAGYTAPPANLTKLAKSDGEVYQIITKGFGEAYFSGRASAKGFVMPPFAKLLTPKERWELVLFIRSFQDK